jgi:hypothetical protein
MRHAMTMPTFYPNWLKPVLLAIGCFLGATAIMLMTLAVHFHRSQAARAQEAANLPPIAMAAVAAQPVPAAAPAAAPAVLTPPAAVPAQPKTLLVASTPRSQRAIGRSHKRHQALSSRKHASGRAFARKKHDPVLDLLR